MRIIGVAAVAAFIASPAQVQASTRLEFITAYVDAMEAHERIRETNAREAAEDGKALALMTMIRGSERYKLEINSEIYAFKAMTLAPPFEFMPEQVAQALELKRDVFGRMSAIATAFLSGPKPGVDYGKLTAEMARLNAQLEHVDKLFWDTSKAVALMLADNNVGANALITQMAITCAERDQLLRTLQLSFGAKLDQSNPGYIVGAGWAIREGLTNPKWTCRR